MSVLRQLAAGGIGPGRSMPSMPLDNRRRAGVLFFALPAAARFVLDNRQKPRKVGAGQVGKPSSSYEAGRDAGGPSTREALLAGLDEREPTAIWKTLEGDHVPIEMRDGGQTILVPAGRGAELTVESTEWGGFSNLPCSLRVPPKLEAWSLGYGIFGEESGVLRGAPSSMPHHHHWSPAQEHENKRGAA